MHATAAGRLTLAIALAWAAHGPRLEASQAASGAMPSPDPQNTKKKPLSRDRYVGDEVCGSCHKDKAATFSKTAHHLTSRLAGADSVAGTFRAGSNVLKTSNPGLFFRMEARGGRYYETAVWGMPPSTTRETEPIDVAIGSGRKGQTYLYWKSGRLFELPVWYWVELGQWFNTPGNADGWARFDRPVMARCLECHGTYADNLAGPQPNNRFEKTTLVLGISCERCHGPGA
jgi:Cytochrome c554 and c-prime